MPASACDLVTVPTKAGVVWQDVQRPSMPPLSEWQVVHDPAFGCLATAGVRVRLARLCAFEIGAGEKADVYQKAAAMDEAPSTNADQRNSANGQGRMRSRVGVQLKRAFPSRGGRWG